MDYKQRSSGLQKQLSFYSQLQVASRNLCVRMKFCEDRKEECLSVGIFF
jgi:hypothetical protein